MAPFDDRASGASGGLRIAVVGTGISGLAAAWLLSRRHDVTVYEKNDRPGGHSNTVVAAAPEGDIPIDTGFIVYNELNYPNLTALLTELGVDTIASEMSFSASIADGAGVPFEYSGSGLNGLFGDRRNIFRPRMWRMLAEIVRLYRVSPGLLAQEGLDQKPLGVFLREQGYSTALREDHLLPMCAAIWSLPVERVEEFPALAFLRFFDNHGLMRLTGRPQWRTVAGGSREYVRRMAASFTDGLRLSTGVTRVVRDETGVTVTDEHGGEARYDHVVIASHSDEALAMLADASDAERALLGNIPYQRNVAWLHSDESLMPKARRVWSSWNYLGEPRAAGGAPVCVTYWMNRLQSLPTKRNFFVTLNPAREPAAETVIRRIEYDHPIFDSAALRAQRELWRLQGTRRTWFCGAYFGSGFHEDGLQAGLAVAEQLGGLKRPWKVENPSGRISLAPPFLEPAGAGALSL